MIAEENEDVVILPIEDVLDLHHFKPKEIPDLLEEYIEACIENGIFSVRIIHGKGQGFLKERVSGILKKNRNVVSFKDAPSDAGGWGATLAELKKFSPPFLKDVRRCHRHCPSGIFIIRTPDI